MKRIKRMAGLFFVAVLLFCQAIVSSAATQEVKDETEGYSDAYTPEGYYHFDLTKKQKKEEDISPKDAMNSGFWIGLGTTVVGGVIAVVIVTKKKSEDEE